MQEEMQLLATGSRDGSVQVCDSSSGEIVARLLRPNPTRGPLHTRISTWNYLISDSITNSGDIYGSVVSLNCGTQLVRQCLAIF